MEEARDSFYALAHALDKKLQRMRILPPRIAAIGRGVDALLNEIISTIFEQVWSRRAGETL